MNLLDVLEHVPLDVVDGNLWSQLPHADHESLAQVSEQSKLLTEQLITRVSHDINRAKMFTPGHRRGGTTAAWAGAFGKVSAKVARLPRLSHLALHDWSSEADLVAALQTYGTGSQHRVTSLVLSHSTHGPIGESSAQAISVACPQLQVLELEVEAAEEEDATGAIVSSLPVAGLFFQPLSTVASLKQLLVRSRCSLAATALHSVGALQHLQHLDMYVEALLPGALSPLSSLRSLRHCDIQTRQPVAASLVDVAPLLTLSQLTQLRLPNLAHSGAATLDPAALHAALASLRALARVEVLDFHHEFDADDAVVASLQVLTQVTKLCLGRLRLTHPMPGHLPLLQQLQLCPLQLPSELRRSLAALLPLPSLYSLSTNYYPDLTLEVGCVDAADAAAEAAALTQVVLSLPPRVLVEGVGPLTLSRAESAPSQLSLAQVGHALQPLAGGSCQLRLVHFHLPDVDWGVMGAFGASLTRLILLACPLSDNGLASVAQRLVGLVHLSVLYCPGLTCAGWLGLAATCPRPLTLNVSHCKPGPPRDLEVWCRAVQVHVFGASTLTWEEHDGHAAVYKSLTA